jgi:hypothetical protein
MFKGDTNLQGPHERGWSCWQPGLFDWDGDGELEIIGNDNTATLRLHDRVDGDMMSLRSSVFTHNGRKLPVGWRSRMTALPGDYGLAGDDRPVLLYIALDSVLSLGIPINAGSTEIAEIRPLAFSDAAPLKTSGSAGMSGRTQISTCDWECDGELDLIMGDGPGFLFGLMRSELQWAAE